MKKMLNESKLYQNLLNVYGKKDAEKGYEKLLKSHGLENTDNIYEIKSGCVVKYYNAIKYFGFDVDKYINNLMENLEKNIYDEIKDDVVIMKIITDLVETNLDVGINMLKKLNLDKIENDNYILTKNLDLLLKTNNKIKISKDCALQYIMSNNINDENMFYDDEQHITILNDIIQLTLDNDFNQPTIIPNNVTHLTFGDSYNCIVGSDVFVNTNMQIYSTNIQVTIIPNSVTHLTFGKCYNQPTLLSHGITHLTFGEYYNQPTILPFGIEKVVFGDAYNQPTVLPISLVDVKFGDNFNNKIKIDTNPKNIRIPKELRNYWADIIINMGGKLMNLPDGTYGPLDNMELRQKSYQDYIEKIKSAAMNMQDMQELSLCNEMQLSKEKMDEICHWMNDDEYTFNEHTPSQNDDISLFGPNAHVRHNFANLSEKMFLVIAKLENITFGDSYNQQFIFPCNAKKIIFGNDYNQQTIISAKTEYVEFGENFDNDVIIKHANKIIVFDDSHEKINDMPMIKLHKQTNKKLIISKN